ncbi:MAG: restriction endonuclease subunit S [Geothermobacteraceae bacterium]
MSNVSLKIGDIAAEEKLVIPPDSTEAANRPYLGLEQIEAQTGKILNYETNSVEGKSNTFAFSQEHVLYGKLRPYLNKVALPDRNGRCSTEIIPLRPINIDREYLALLLRTNKIVDAVMAEKTGSRMPRADLDVLLNIEVSVPDTIEKQRQIAARLKAQLAEVDKARQAVEVQLRELNFALNQIIEEQITRVIGKAKHLVTLGQVSSITAKIVDPTRPEFCDLPHVSAENIESMTGRLINIQSAKADAMTSGKYLFDKGDILYSKLRPYLRKVAKSPFEGLCSADMYPIKVDENCLDAGFLKLLLTSNLFTDYANEKSARSRMPKLNREQLFEFEFSLPSIRQQHECVQRVGEAVECVTQATSSAKKILTDMNILPQKILAQAFEM